LQFKKNISIYISIFNFCQLLWHHIIVSEREN
jgi:hypothetical protein